MTNDPIPSTQCIFNKYEKPLLILEAVFAVALSILVIGSDPRLRLGAELMTRIENATANTDSWIRNSS